MNRQRLAAGLALVAFPLVVQIPFNLLVVKFSYPDILLRTPDEVLTRFHAGGSEMVLTWYAYALCTLGLAFVAAMLPGVLGQKGAVARLSVISGVVASVAQLLGLLRWSMVVPFIASRWVEHPEQRPALEVAYEVQHRLFGVMLGEHVGQLGMGVWTVLVSVMLLRVAAPKVIAATGFVAGALFILGMGAQLGRAVPVPSVVLTFPLLAFVAWSVWALAAGVTIALRGSKLRFPSPANA